ncbi:MAG: hypothetical protein U5N86_04580 [Planctomycetota bacterium]|nr:hypothetical protein [Planctomycetota bacterium]
MTLERASFAFPVALEGPDTGRIAFSNSDAQAHKWGEGDDRGKLFAAYDDGATHGSFVHFDLSGEHVDMYSFAALLLPGLSLEVSGSCGKAEGCIMRVSASVELHGADEPYEQGGAETLRWLASWGTSIRFPCCEGLRRDATDGVLLRWEAQREGLKCLCVKVSLNVGRTDGGAGLVAPVAASAVAELSEPAAFILEQRGPGVLL